MDTIYALSSGVGRVAVAVVRITGPSAGDVARALCGGLPPPRKAALRTLRRPADGLAIDRAIVIWFPAPHSYSGEDLCELHVHGGRAVVQALFDGLDALGLRLAQPGEFSRRAFFNGKLDLTELEGLADLLASDTEQQRRQAFSQSQGGLRQQCDAWRDELLALRAQIEARLDFSDEADVPSALPESFRGRISCLLSGMQGALDRSLGGERLREGFRVAILGPPNVGKSSLLNALAHREVAIVTAEAGTTRDVIEVLLDLRGYPVRLFDTAGLRDTDSEPEQIGINRARDVARSADLALWLDDGPAASSTPPPDDVAETVIRIASKADLRPARTGDSLDVSAVSGLGLQTLLDRIEAEAAASLNGSGAIVTRERHRLAIRDAASALALSDCEAEEIVADLLRGASEAIARVTGQIGAEDVLDRLFGEFCIGK